MIKQIIWVVLVLLLTKFLLYQSLDIICPAPDFNSDGFAPPVLSLNEEQQKIELKRAYKKIYYEEYIEMYAYPFKLLGDLSVSVSVGVTALLLY
jgi:hypothetical protein